MQGRERSASLDFTAAVTDKCVLQAARSLPHGQGVHAVGTGCTKYMVCTKSLNNQFNNATGLGKEQITEGLQLHIQEVGFFFFF